MSSSSSKYLFYMLDFMLFINEHILYIYSAIIIVLLYVLVLKYHPFIDNNNDNENNANDNNEKTLVFLIMIIFVMVNSVNKLICYF